MAALRELYKTLEFSSLLREIGPGREVAIAGARLSKRLKTKRRLEAWLAALPADAPVAVAAGRDDVGDRARAIPADNAGVSRSIALAKITRARHRRARYQIADPPIRRCTGLKHDVMLYGFLISADPGALRSGVARRTLSGSTPSNPIRPAMPTPSLRSIRSFGRRSKSLGLGELYESIDLPLVRVLARMEESGVRVDPGAARVLSMRMEEEIARLSARSTSWPARPSTSTLRSN